VPPKRPKAAPFELGGHHVAAGSRARIPLRVGSFLTYEDLRLEVVVAHGKSPGPSLLLTAGIHGDEYNGTEIVRRMLRHPRLRSLLGTLLAIPIVNRPAFVTRSRYLPDRRDLNRLFPGSSSGSLGARLASVLCNEVLDHADAVIDFHTGAVNRPNLPQIRISAGDPASLDIARAFAPPVILGGPPREGSFRHACRERELPYILYEAGEALRLDTPSIRFGVQGVLGVMEQLKMLPARRSRRHAHTVVSTRSAWERAPTGGIFTPLVALGKAVQRGTPIGFIADPHGEEETPVESSRDGLVIGRTNEAVVDEGDGVFHIANIEDLSSAESRIAGSAGALPSLTTDEDDHPVPYDTLNDSII